MGGPVFAAIAAAMLAGQPAEASATCQLTFSAGPQITETLRERGFGFASYDRLCAAAGQHGLELTITGSSGVLTERAYGWASVTARRTASGALSTREHLTTYLDAEATASVAVDLLYTAINESADAVMDELATHLQSIEAEEARMRATERQRY